MREKLGTLLLSLALLALPPSERKVDSHTDNSGEIEAAVGFVKALVEKRSMDALLRLHPSLLLEISAIGSARLTHEQEDAWSWLHWSVSPLLEGCRVSGGIGLNDLQVQVKFEESCGREWTHPLESVVVPLRRDPEGKPYPTGLLTFRRNGLDE